MLKLRSQRDESDSVGVDFQIVGWKDSKILSEGLLRYLEAVVLLGGPIPYLGTRYVGKLGPSFPVNALGWLSWPCPARLRLFLDGLSMTAIPHARNM